MRVRELIEALEELERRHVGSSDWRVDVGLTVVDRRNRERYSSPSLGLGLRHTCCETGVARQVLIEGGDTC